MVIFHSCVKLPEGNHAKSNNLFPQFLHQWSPDRTSAGPGSANAQRSAWDCSEWLAILGPNQLILLMVITVTTSTYILPWSPMFSPKTQWFQHIPTDPTDGEKMTRHSATAVALASCALATWIPRSRSTSGDHGDHNAIFKRKTMIKWQP